MDTSMTRSAGPAFDALEVRSDFPLLSETIHGKPLVYLDNAASTQKPRAVIDAVSNFYCHSYSNVHRGVHALSVRATEAYEGARDTMRDFLGAADRKEIVFVRGTTEGINLVAQGMTGSMGPGDEVLISGLEHHSNIVPWQMLCERTGAKLQVARIDDSGEVDLDEYRRLLSPRTRIVAMSHISNALGTVNPVKEMIALARAAGSLTLVDGAQAAAHMPIDVQDLDADFYTISSHKMFGPSGIGVLYGKQARLEALPPYQGGGDMILSVTFEKTTYNELPYRFEAGTPCIEAAVGMGVAARYLMDLGFDRIEPYESRLLQDATDVLRQVPDVQLIGTARNKASVISFTLGDIHSHDVGTIVDSEAVAIRVGHHCAQPVMDRFGVSSTCRASLAMYNTLDDVKRLAEALHKVREVFRL
ncbi:cysteine sulfinate desulfinase [Acidobacteria bacterium Mor1]|nr:cysteine sulfinate desulfinase [Acidobacteria bacterium Mor1]